MKYEDYVELGCQALTSIAELILWALICPLALLGWIIERLNVRS